MKKLILSVTALAACSLGAHAQGLIVFSTGSSGALVSINGATDTTQDINAELLWSSTANGTFNPVAELLLSSSNTSSDGAPGFDSSDILSAAKDITSGANGHLLDASGQQYQPSASVASGAAVYYEIEGWLGNYSSLAAAAAAGQASGTSAAFLGSVSASGNPTEASLSTFSGLNLTTTVIPEPSTLAMAGVGLASMLFMRRKIS